MAQQGIRDDEVLEEDDDLETPPPEGGQKEGEETPPPAPQAGDETVVTAEDPERAAIRERRRQEKEDRKRRQREAIARRDREIQGLKGQISELSSQVTHLANRTTGSDMARVDAAIEAAGQEIEISSTAMEEAAKAGDWKIHREAQDSWYSARRKQEELTAFKRQVTSGQQREAAATGGAVRRAQPHPDLMRHAKEWMGNNTWYDPNLGNEDSRIAHVIDQGMAAEGYDPRTPEYWDELTDRLRERLPKRYAAGGNGGGGNGRDRQITGSGSGRESPGGSARVTISKERIDSMREAGIDWDDPKVRARMIKRFQEADKAAPR